MKKVIVLSLSAILMFAMLLGTPKIFELVYMYSKTTENLLILCKISNVFRNEKLVLEYYPKLIFDNENNNIPVDEKDEMIYVFLETVVRLDDFEDQKKYLKKSYLSFSGIESATIGGTGFISSYYDETKDKKRCYELYELLLDSSSTLNYEFKNGIYTKYISFIIENNDYELLKRVRKERIDFLKNNGVDLWDDEDQSALSGDGAIVD